jgi:hypothetical protein
MLSNILKLCNKQKGAVRTRLFVLPAEALAKAGVYLFHVPF